MLRLKEKLTFRCETEDEAKALIKHYKQDGRTNGYEVNKVSYQYKEKKLKGEVADSCWQVDLELIYTTIWAGLEG